MALYDCEIIHHITYRKRVRANSQQEADDKAAEMWMYRDLKHMVDEDIEASVHPVAEPAPPKRKRKAKDGTS